MGTNEKIDATGALDACRRSTDTTRRIHFARLTASQRACRDLRLRTNELRGGASLSRNMLPVGRRKTAGDRSNSS